MRDARPMTFVCAIRKAARKPCGKKFTTFTQLLLHIASHYHGYWQRRKVSDIAQLAREAGL